MMAANNDDKDRYRNGCAVSPCTMPPKRERPDQQELYVWSELDVLGSILLPYGADPPKEITINSVTYKREKK